MNDTTLLHSSVPELPRLARGQVRDIDEVLTPDSSRFWPADGYAPGKPQPSFDKQYGRDYLEAPRWDKRPPAPPLPPDIIRQTSEKYRDALQRVAGIALAPAPARDAADDALTV